MHYSSQFSFGLLRAARCDALRAWMVAALIGLVAWPWAAEAKPPADSSPVGSFYSNFQGARLVDQDGRRFDAMRLEGHIVLVNFFFTGCSTVCPPQTRALGEVQRQLPPALRSRVRLLSVSLDPLADTPQALKRFTQRMEVDLSGWAFVTGRPQDIERISDALRLYRPEKDVRKPDDHSTALWLVDPKGSLRIRYNGSPPDVNRLVREIGALDALLQAPKS
jgi:protein SCO1/2